MKKVWHFYNLLLNKKATTLAGGISFFILINGGAFLYLVLILTRNSLNIYLNEDYIPIEVIKVFNYFVSNARSSISGSIFVIFTTFWGASSLFYHFIKCGEIIYNKKREREKIINRAFSLLAMIAFLILIMLSVFIIISINYLLSFVVFIFLKRLIQFVIFFFLPFVLILFINIYVPPIKIRIKEAILGSLFTVIYGALATFVFTTFLKISKNFGAIYGSLAFVIVFLIWIYILTNGLIIGFIINYQKNHSKKMIL